MRERGVQSRRVRESKEAARRPAPATGVTNIWQIIAIIALLAATAGWTTVGVIALRGSGPAAVASPSEPTETDPLDEESIPPVADSHDAPELEAFLPKTVEGVDLQVQSVTGPDFLADDGYSTTLTTFLTSVGKAPADLHLARAYDPDETLDGTFEVYGVAGVDGAKLRETLIAAWKVDFPEIKVTDVTIGGQPMMRIDFDPDTPSSYLYVSGEHLFDIWTSDPEIAAAALAALPGASGAPGPSRSAAPAGSTAPAP